MVFVTHERDVAVVDLVGRSSKLLIGPESGSAAISHNVAYFSPGHAPGHVHTVEEEVFFVTDGQGEVWMEGMPYALRPGTAVHTPQGVVHNVHTTVGPLRLLGLMSPHGIPGAYPNLPPRSRDLDAPPANRAPFIVYEDEALAGGSGVVLRTGRLEVAIRRLAAGASMHVAAAGGDLVIHVLEGAGVLADGPRTTPIEPGTACLLTGSDTATVVAEAPLRLLEARGIATMAPGAFAPGLEREELHHGS